MLQDVHLEGVAGAPALYQPSRALVHTGHTNRYSGMHTHTCTYALCTHTHICTHTGKHTDEHLHMHTRALVGALA